MFYLKLCPFPIKQRENGGTGGYRRVYHLEEYRNKSIHITQHKTLFFFNFFFTKKKGQKRKILRKVIPKFERTK